MNLTELENAVGKMTPGPVHQLVGQLRELLSRATPGPWCAPNPDNCPGHLECREIGYIGHLELHSPSSPFQRADPKDDYALIVAAVSALPALLAIAEAADAILVCGDLHWHTPQADRNAAPELIAAAREREELKAKLEKAEKEIAACNERSDSDDAASIGLIKQRNEAQALANAAIIGQRVVEAQRDELAALLREARMVINQCGTTPQRFMADGIIGRIDAVLAKVGTP